MLCSNCSNLINPERLKAVPSTNLCKECKSKIEGEIKVNSKREKKKIPLKGPTKSATLENFINVINAAIL